MAKRKQTEYIQGHATHRRTEGDYMGVLLDAVTLDDWRGVVTGADARAGGIPCIGVAANALVDLALAMGAGGCERGCRNGPACWCGCGSPERG